MIKIKIVFYCFPFCCDEITLNPLNAKDVYIRPCTCNSATKDVHTSSSHMFHLRPGCSGTISLVAEKGMGTTVKSTDQSLNHKHTFRDMLHSGVFHVLLYA